MSRFIKIGLLASTMLAMAAPAVAQRGQDRDGAGRGEWSRGAGRSDQSRGDGDRQRGWSAPTPQAAPAREPAPAVRTTPVPPADASGGAWRRLGNARPDGDNGNWQRGRDANRDRTPPVVAAPAQPQPQAQPQRRNWSRNDGTPGQRDWNRDDRNDRNDRNDRGTWSGNDRNGRDNGNWNRGNNEWRGNDNNWQRDRQRDEVRNRDWQRQQQQGYNYQRRLQERERWADTRRWDNGWRNSNRYDWQRHRAQNRNFYHLPAYYAPYGWNRGYSRFSIGFYLSNVLFASDYWIDDPYEYRLPPAYGPLRWVRYYDDALLVDIRDGYVVDVIHDFFW